MHRLARLLPRPVKTAMKAFRINPMEGTPRQYRSRLARERAMARARAEARRGTAGVTPTSPPANDAGDGPVSPEGARDERRVARLRARLDEAVSGRLETTRERDEARQTLQEVRARLRTLEQQVRFPEEAWWEQRAKLARWEPGGGLTDFSYFPGGTQNPYLRMLYARLPEVGFDPRPLPRFDYLNRLAPDAVFHLHWTRIAQLGAETEAEAQETSDRFLDTVAAFVERGGTLLWSVHEPLPHDCPFPEIEMDLRQHLVDLAAGVHVLHHSTVDTVAPYYRIPEDKLFVVEHPLYTGIYPTYLTRDASRRLIGLDDDQVAIIAFGAIRPYKGFDRLVRLLPRLQKETGRDVRVIVAGPTMQSIDNSELLELVATTEGASITEDPIPDEHVQVLFKAADVVALPYRQVMNSGVLMLGLTFGCPSIAPENEVTRDTLGSGLVQLFDQGDEDDLYRVLKKAVEEAATTDHELSPAFATRYDPAQIAGEFAAELRRILDT